MERSPSAAEEIPAEIRLHDDTGREFIIRPPLVKDFQTFADDITHLQQWRKNRIIRIFLILILCGLGSLIGTLLGTSKIVFSLLSLN